MKMQYINPPTPRRGGGRRGKEEAAEQGALYLEPVDAEDGTFVVVGMSRLRLALRRDLIEADFLIPTGDCQEVLLGALVRVEGEVCDAVGGWLLDLDILLQVSNSVRSRCCSGRATEETRHFGRSAILRMVRKEKESREEPQVW
jgi:hypothetical protein